MYLHFRDVVVHRDESPDDKDIHALERDMAGVPAVYSARADAPARHLMPVDCDPADLRVIERPDGARGSVSVQRWRGCEQSRRGAFRWVSHRPWRFDVCNVQSADFMSKIPGPFGLIDRYGR
jgi:hypothetical protein